MAYWVQVAQTKAPVTVAVRQPDKPISYEVVLSDLPECVAVVGLADGEHSTSQPSGEPTLAHNLFGHLASARWSGHFFARYSLAICAFSFS
jgi:hypothetical protein